MTLEGLDRGMKKPHPIKPASAASVKMSHAWGPGFCAEKLHFAVFLYAAPPNTVASGR
jgi:hypothetical protein